MWVGALTLAHVCEPSRGISLLGKVVHSPARAIRTAKKPLRHDGTIHLLLYFIFKRRSPSSHTHLTEAYDMSRSPSAVRVNIVVPIFMLALRATNHWALVANPITYHFPVICGHAQGKHCSSLQKYKYYSIFLWSFII